MTEREQRLAAKVKDLEEKLAKANHRIQVYKSRQDDDLWLTFIEKVAKSQSKFGAEAKKLLAA